MGIRKLSSQYSLTHTNVRALRLGCPSVQQSKQPETLNNLTPLFDPETHYRYRDKTELYCLILKTSTCGYVHHLYGKQRHCPGR